MDELFQYAKLVKFVDNRFAKDIMDGKIYCNTLEFFRKTSFAGGQNDINDGIATMYDENDYQITITVDGKNTCVFCVSMLIPRYYVDDGKRGYYKLSDVAKEKFKNFGDSSYREMDCITIVCVDEFIRRVKNACANLNVKMFNCKVEYGDRSYPSQQLNTLLKTAPAAAVFIKEKKYAWQEEYRFVFYDFPANIKRESNGAFILKIGDISDIAHRTEHCFV